MQKINQLSKHMANLIAAGEVVERPASVVKELMENSIDAGATSVTVEITDGGITSISVTDNGSGIARDDVETAFLRHATSKIRTEDDLAKIETMGFRGEALAAIAAVSRIALQTKTADETVGTGIELEGGVVTNLTDIGCPNGTKIMVCDLFFNTPARHKFLKKDSTEASYVQTVCQRVAMANPSIAIKFIKDGKIELHTPGDGNLYTVLYCLFGRETAQGLTEVRYDREPVSVYGYVSKPTMSRASRGMQYLFVNGRPVKNATMQAALEEAFRGKLVSGRFPYAFLNLTVPADSVDVNVHPAKTEVKFGRKARI
ncbi:MAG: DNA mismatch repair endonuclease MutL [Ruminococcaceae bacterium]|nr:DNA mismatch repair endonuclease MutL [Oscillospiraceae bacterium]